MSGDRRLGKYVRMGTYLADVGRAYERGRTDAWLDFNERLVALYNAQPSEQVRELIALSEAYLIGAQDGR